MTDKNSIVATRAGAKKKTICPLKVVVPNHRYVTTKKVIVHVKSAELTRPARARYWTGPVRISNKNPKLVPPSKMVFFYEPKWRPPLSSLINFVGRCICSLNRKCDVVQIMFTCHRLQTSSETVLFLLLTHFYVYSKCILTICVICQQLRLKCYENISVI